jgi:hypothetical protein
VPDPERRPAAYHTGPGYSVLGRSAPLTERKWGNSGGREQAAIVFSRWHRPPLREAAAVSGRLGGGVDAAQRNPLLVFLLSGLFLLRFAARTLFWLLFQEPPRSLSGLSPQGTALIPPALPLDAPMI